MSDTIKVGTTSQFGGIGEFIDRTVRLDQHQNTMIAEGMPPLAELARAGVLYGANNGSAVGLGNVAAIPTTTATYGLYNNHSSKHLVVIKVAVIATSLTPTADLALIAGLPGTPQASAETKYASSLALAINSNAASGTTPGGYLTDAVTLADTPLWQTIGTANNTGALLGHGVVAWVNGMYVVPPGYCLGLDMLASAGTTPLYDIDILWAELELKLG